MANHFAGKNGKVTFDSEPVLNVYSWQATFNQDVTEVTVMGATGNWKDFIVGQYDWEATVEAYVSSTFSENLPIYDSTATNVQLGSGDSSNVDGNKFYLQLQFDTTAGTPIEIKGYAFLTGKSVSQDNSSPVTATYTFKGIPSTAGVGPAESAVA